MSLNPNTYVKCPYCAMSYKDDTEEHRDAIAGHINLKHPDKPAVKRAKDFRVEIPSDDFNAPHHSKERLQKPEKTLEEGLETVLDKEDEVEAMKPKDTPPTAEEFNEKNKELKLTAKQKLRQKLEQQLKELNDSE